MGGRDKNLKDEEAEKLQKIQLDNRIFVSPPFSFFIWIELVSFKYSNLRGVP